MLIETEFRHKMSQLYNGYNEVFNYVQIRQFYWILDHNSFSSFQPSQKIALVVYRFWWPSMQY